jgi:hypothetical protein
LIAIGQDSDPNECDSMPKRSWDMRRDFLVAILIRLHGHSLSAAAHRLSETIISWNAIGLSLWPSPIKPAGNIPSAAITDSHRFTEFVAQKSVEIESSQLPWLRNA